MSHKKNYVPQFLKQRDINSYFHPVPRLFSVVCRCMVVSCQVLTVGCPGVTVNGCFWILGVGCRSGLPWSVPSY